MRLNVNDKKLIDRLQQGLPLEPDPYGIIAKELAIPRSEIPARIKELQKAGYLRRLGGVFDASQMGFRSLLVGASIPDIDLPEFIDIVNRHPGVTHNYLRQGRLNLWFTLATASPEKTETFLEGLAQRFPNIVLHQFPRITNYKLKVFFPMEED